MCTPAIVRQSARGRPGSAGCPDRRELLRAGCAAVAGAALGTGRVAAQAPAAPRPLTYTRVADLTHPLTADFPLYPSPAYTPFRKSPIAEYRKDGFFANRWE